MFTMKKIARLTCCAFMACCTFIVFLTVMGNTSHAQRGSETPQSAPDFIAPEAKKEPVKKQAKQNTITQVQSYLNSLNTFAAQFEQTAAGGHPSSGVFYFKKPGKFLWHYLKPDPAKLVSSGGTIYFHDESNNQTTQVPRKGLADLLTRETIQLGSDSFSVADVYLKGGLLYVTVKIDNVAEGDVGGKVQMTFLQNPLQLRQMTTINQMNQPVDVLFYNIKENKSIPDDVFKFVPFHYRQK